MDLFRRRIISHVLGIAADFCSACGDVCRCRLTDHIEIRYHLLSVEKRLVTSKLRCLRCGNEKDGDRRRFPFCFSEPTDVDGADLLRETQPALLNDFLEAAIHDPDAVVPPAIADLAAGIRAGPDAERDNLLQKLAELRYVSSAKEALRTTVICWLDLDEPERDRVREAVRDLVEQANRRVATHALLRTALSCRPVFLEPIRYLISVLSVYFLSTVFEPEVHLAITAVGVPSAALVYAALTRRFERWCENHIVRAGETAGVDFEYLAALMLRARTASMSTSPLLVELRPIADSVVDSLRRHGKIT